MHFIPQDPARWRLGIKLSEIKENSAKHYCEFSIYFNDLKLTLEFRTKIFEQMHFLKYL